MKNKFWHRFLCVTVAMVCTASAFSLSGCKSKLERARGNFNPSNYEYVTVSKYSSIVSNRYAEVDVRQHGIPLGASLISYDGKYLYFAGGKMDTNSETIDDYMDIYAYDPINKQSKKVNGITLNRFRQIFIEDGEDREIPRHLKTAYVYSQNEVVFIGTGHDFESLFYKVTLDANGKLLQKQKFTANMNKEVFNEAETLYSNYKLKFNGGDDFDNIVITDGEQEKFVFKNSKDDVWNLIKDDSKIDKVTFMGPYANGYAVIQISIRRGGLVTGNTEYYYFVCSFDKSDVEFFAFSDNGPYGKIFIED